MQTFRKRRAGLSATAGLSCFVSRSFCMTAGLFNNFWINFHEILDGSLFADPQYSADHGPLPHISPDDVKQQKYSINRLYDKYVTCAVRNSEI